MIPSTGLVEELNEIFKKDKLQPIVKCKLFEDNHGVLKLADVPTYKPKSKHIALKYHHFRKIVKEGRVQILPIDTKKHKYNLK